MGPSAARFSSAAPAAAWGIGGLASAGAASASGQVPAEAGVDAATPPLHESFALGVMMADQSQGLRSGGLLGYSTAFTGYDPSRGHGMGRAMSLGRLANQGIAVASRGLLQTGLADTAAGTYLRAGTMAEQIGLQGVVSAMGSEDIRRATSGMRERYVQRSLDVAFGRAWQKETGMTPGEYIDENGRAIYEREKFVRKGNLDFDEAAVTRRAREESRRRASRYAAKSQRTGLSKMMGWLGGEGLDEQGRAAGRYVASTVEGETIFTRQITGKSMGGLLKGSAGRAAGLAIKGMGWIEVGMMAAEAAGSAIGAGYKGMIQAADRLDRQVGRPEQMSMAYRSRAATTERQRAKMALQDSKLNPRTQMRGNEAFFMSD